MLFGPELVWGWTRELRESFQDCQVLKIEGGDRWIAVKLKKTTWLFVSWNTSGYGCSISDTREIKELKELSTKKPSFVDALNRHILRSRINNAMQLDKDRVLKLEFNRPLGAGRFLQRFLVVESMERNSNVILLDEAGIVLEAAKHVFPEMNRYRSILPGQPYVTPPPFEARELTEHGKDSIRYYLQKPKGLGRPLSRSINAGIDKESSSTWERYISQLYNDRFPLTSFQLQRIDKYLTLFPTLVSGGTPSTSNSPLMETKSVTINILLNQLRSGLISRANTLLQREIKRKKHHLQGLQSQRKNATRANDYKTIGQMLLANSYHLKSGQRKITLTSWMNDGPEEISISLDPSLNIIENASKYFKQYKKYKVNVKDVDLKIDALRGTITELEEQMEMLSLLDNGKLLKQVLDDLTKSYGSNGSHKTKEGKKKGKDSTSPPHLRFQIRESLILVGLNARGNRYVTFKQASGNDLWFHVHEIPGSHVILKAPPSDPDEREYLIKLSASLAAHYSRGKSCCNVMVDYTERKHVRHIPGSGLAHVTFKYPKTISTDPTFWKGELQETF